jgi:hypothetical protein
MSTKTSKKSRSGGYSNYSIRSATLVQGYMPGPMRQNLIMDPDKAIGKIDFGTFGSDELINNGPGTILQAVPDATRSQYARIFEAPRGNAFRDFAIDDRQVAGYQVEQLQNNPLSQYTINPDGAIPGFECKIEPNNYSTMVTKRKDEYKNFFEGGGGEDLYNWGQPVYEKYSGTPINANAEVVYNLSMDSKEIVNPMISAGSSNIARSKPDFGGKCYSGIFTPGKSTGDMGGPNPPKLYNNYSTRPREQGDIGFMNKNNNGIVEIADRSLDFANPLVLNSF